MKTLWCVAALLLTVLTTGGTQTACPRTPVTDADVKAVAQAIEDEIYDYGYQGWDFDWVAEKTGPEGYQVRFYIQPYFELKKEYGDTGRGRGQIIYKFMPFGEVYRLFTVDEKGLAVIYGNPEFRFEPVRPNYLTLYMDDDQLCQFKREWRKASFLVNLRPSAERLREAAARQKLRIGHSVREEPGWRLYPSGKDPRCDDTGDPSGTVAGGVPQESIAHGDFKQLMRPNQRAREDPGLAAGPASFLYDYGQLKPPWTARKIPSRSFGPFEDEKAGGDVPIGARVFIRIYP